MSNLESDAEIEKHLKECTILQPLPILPVNWCTGWKSGPPKYANEINMARRCCMKNIFKVNELSYSESLQIAKNLTTYAKLIIELVVCNSSKARQIRSRPLEFCWCFACEHMPEVTGMNIAHEYGDIAVMKTCYPAFEAICSLIAAIIIYYRAVVEIHDAMDQTRIVSLQSHENTLLETLTTAANGVLECCQKMQDWMPTLPHNKASKHKIFSQAQWSRLVRQKCPMQLQQWWPCYMRQLCLHRFQLLLLKDQSQTTTRIENNNNTIRSQAMLQIKKPKEHNAATDIIRACKVSSQQMLDQARKALIYSGSVCMEHQVDILQYLYDVYILEYLHFEAHLLTSDIQTALADISTQHHSTNLLLELRKVWTELTKHDTTPSLQQEQWYTRMQTLIYNLNAHNQEVTVEQTQAWRESQPKLFCKLILSTTE